MIDGIKLAVGGVMWFFQWFGATIWMLVYAIGSLLLMFLDFVQDCFKKLAGLDTYYYEGTTTAFEKEDILQRLLTTPEILKAFGSLVVVGIILLFIFTIVQFIRIEYTTEGAKNSKGNIIQQSLKSLAMFVIVPVATLIGIFLSNKILQILDNATDPSPGSTIAGNIFKISVYDANPVRAGESKISGFGKMQQEAIFLSDYDAYEGPEWKGSYLGKNFWGTVVTKVAKLKIDGYENDNMDAIKGFANVAKLQVEDTGKTEVSPTGIVTSVYKIFVGSEDVVFSNFWSGLSMTVKKIDPTQLAPSVLSGKDGEDLAEAIDDMMSHRNREDAQITTNAYTGDWKGNFTGVGLKKGDGLDYTNTFAVAYFYNMQDISYFTLFVCSGFALVCLYKAAFGMVMRLYMCAILFVISPPIIAMAPMDNGKALSSWKSKFIGQVLAGYGTVVALNLFFTVLPIIEKIELFSDTHTNELTGKADVPWRVLPASFFNGLVQMVFVLVGCFMLKDISKTISGLIGAEDAMASGDGMSKQIGSVATKAASVGLGVAGAGAGLAMKMGSKLAGKIGTAGKGKFDKAGENLDDAKKAAENDAVAQKLGFKDYGSITDKGDLEAFNSLKAGMTDDEKQEIADAVEKDDRVVSATEAFNKAGDKYYGGKLKAGMRNLSTSGYLMGERFSAAGSSNVKRFMANTSFAKTSKEIFGDAAPELLGGKGSHAFDGQIAGKNDVLKEEIDRRAKAKEKAREEKSVEKMGAVATAVAVQNDIATQEKVGADLVKTLDVNSQKAVREVQDLKNKMLDVMKQMQAGIIGVEEGRSKMSGMYNQARTDGILTDKSEKSIGEMLSKLGAVSQPGSGVMLKDVAAQLTSNTSFESKIEVMMKDSQVQEELKRLQDAVKNNKYTTAAQASEKLKEALGKQGIKIDSIQQIMEKIAADSAKSKIEEKDLKKLLAQLAKLSK